MRDRLERLIGLPNGAEEWVSFTRDNMRLAPWLLPAVQAAVRQGGWRTAADPVVQIRSAVHKLAIQMRLRNAEKPAPPVDLLSEE